MSKKLALIDADTILYQSAAVIQEAPLVVEHKLSGRKKEFKNKTSWKEFLASDKGKGYAEDDFNIVQEPRLREDISHALHLIKLQFEKIAKKDWCEDYHIYIGGEGNYRKEHATIKPYKGTRPPKPIAFAECYEYVCKKYKNRLTICNGEEAEDGVAVRAWPVYREAKAARDKDKANVVIARVDKDLIQVPGWHYNYGKDSELTWVSDVEAARHFWWQVLKGDTTDDIVGLQGIGQQTREKYGISVTKGCGEKSADKILEGAKNEREFATRVVDAYKDFYGKDWQKVFKENCILLRMRSYDGELFDAVQYVKNLGVEL